ncbi:phorbol-12-myristate-13-acetate-induced protein 1 [Erythrolamprus reginae]|uniref:phorbol-12-myristate-13-acetate-induced protein 1 n=1 Tax=Erythrolamprus reginae TaxID=121349 RepID=UPI00396C7721
MRLAATRPALPSNTPLLPLLLRPASNLSPLARVLASDWRRRKSHQRRRRGLRGDVMGKPHSLYLSPGLQSSGRHFSRCRRAERTFAPVPLPAFRSHRAEGSRASCTEMMPTKTPRKPALQNPAPAECSAAIALQLRKIGDKWNLRQRILNMIAKLFCPGT